MKNFVKPELVELNINETAWGIFDSCIEIFPILDHDCDCKGNENKKPSTPSENPNTPNQAS